MAELRLRLLALALALGSADAHAASVPCKVFLVPGAFGAGTSSLFLKAEAYFAEYREFFVSKGCEVKKAEFPPDATIEVRALILKDQLARFAGTGPSRLILVAHSQGGLDARFALRTLGMPEVSALVTIGTPHSGTPVASWVVWHREKGSLLYWVLRWFGGYDLRALSFAGEMTPEFLQKFRARFDVVPGVHYASAQGVCRTHCHGALRALARWVGLRDGDGIVERDSQFFGEDLGEYDLDHLSEVGTDPEKRSERARFLSRIWTRFGDALR